MYRIISSKKFICPQYFLILITVHRCGETPLLRNWQGFTKVSRCVRLVNPRIINLNVQEYHENGFFTVRDVFVYNTLIKFYKYFKLNFNKEFVTKILNIQVQHRHPTRFCSDNKLILPFQKKALAQKSFVYSSISLWNQLTSDLRNISCIHGFKRNLKLSILTHSAIAQLSFVF